jgi:hypothetical protein
VSRVTTRGTDAGRGRPPYGGGENRRSGAPSLEGVGAWPPRKVTSITAGDRGERVACTGINHPPHDIPGGGRAVCSLGGHAPVPAQGQPERCPADRYGTRASRTGHGYDETGPRRSGHDRVGDEEHGGTAVSDRTSVADRVSVETERVVA